METQCKIRMVNHYTPHTNELLEGVQGMEWPRGSTLLSIALGRAEAEQKYSRADVQSVVLVITNSKPISQHNTKAAAKMLQQKARVIWIPIGADAPLETIKCMASKPEDDHVVHIPGFQELLDHRSEYLNRIITSVCPHVS